ncbi:MAG: SDR family NAD(P)-dependent oxidoreductase [Anaerolineae bacterium]
MSIEHHTPRDLNEKGTVFITGASSGIGAAFAKQLGRQGFDLVLTGRRRERLDALADALAGAHGIQVDVITTELADPDMLAMLVERVRSESRLEMLINNAGFGTGGAPFHEQNYAMHQAMLKVHIEATVRLTYAALPALLAQRRGAIINVSSLAAFFPLPYHTMYVATKEFIRVFSEALAIELRGSGVRIQALCPGFTRTDFHARLGFNPDQFYRTSGPMRAMSPEEVVQASLNCLARGKVVCVPGAHNQFASHLACLVPRRLQHWLLERFGRRTAM